MMRACVTPTTVNSGSVLSSLLNATLGQATFLEWTKCRPAQKILSPNGVACRLQLSTTCDYQCVKKQRKRNIQK